MRTIKFRGKRIDNGEWVYGNLFVPNKLVRGTYISPETDYADFYPGKEAEDIESTIDEMGIALGSFYEVHPETVGQFTGLLDKNGKEVYEGDVVVAKSDGYTHKGEIRWRLEGAPTIIIYPAFANEGFWSLHGHKIEPGSATITVFGKVEYHKGDKTIIIDDGVEVIGNIHETTPA